MSQRRLRAALTTDTACHRKLASYKIGSAGLRPVPAHYRGQPTPMKDHSSLGEELASGASHHAPVSMYLED